MSRHYSQTAKTEARALGWASIGIGLAEIAAPNKIQDLLGVPDEPTHRGVLRMLGVRELMHGFSLLTAEKSRGELSPSVWSRVAGDVLDTAVLGVAATKTRSPAKFAAVSAVILGIGLLDWKAARDAQKAERRYS